MSRMEMKRIANLGRKVRELEAQVADLVRVGDGMVGWLESIAAGDEKPLNMVSIKRRLKAGRDLVQLDVCHCCGEEKVGVREVFFNPGNGPEGAGQLMCQDCIDDEEKQGRYYE